LNEALSLSITLQGQLNALKTSLPGLTIEDMRKKIVIGSISAGAGIVFGLILGILIAGRK
jgi:hypothetical protein